MSNNILASIVIVNYNGKHFLEQCFSSLFSMDTPKHSYEIILVDNHSWDDSVVFTKTHFPQVRIVENKENLGFSAGNNVGAKIARGKYIAFLNNDTKVDRLWLSSLIHRIEKNSTIAAVSSKALLYYPFFRLHVQSDTYAKSDFMRFSGRKRVGVSLENVTPADIKLKPYIQYGCGFYDVDDKEAIEKWTDGDAELLIPFDPLAHEVRYTVTLSTDQPFSGINTELSLTIEDNVLIHDTLAPHETKQYTLVLHADQIKKYAKYAVQNAGNIVFKDGYSRDRGAAVRKTTQIFELDCPFYDKPVEVLAFCGVGVLVREDIFTKLGGFDELYFMYYEDIDLSLTMRRYGYSIWYEPKAVMYHIHAGSSKEGSRFFASHVEKGRLILIAKHFPLFIVCMQFGLYVLSFLFACVSMMKGGLRGNWRLYETLNEKVESRGDIMKWVVGHIFFLVKKRFVLKLRQKKSMSEIFQSLY